ncbi:alkaline phosphatase family protein [Clostridium tagluense]|uniref:Phosphodiesterase n=1 Tax=Clostridium tagluense TaxID=360422 RepID=A0A401UMU1_9CLOT|nr:alkaline phosphatase family protein [Clostridium tagluense]GCD10842.1 phosphodiesterase [Clostridium tagluense]
MINKKSIEEVGKSKYKECTIPLYDSYCFSNIFGSIKHLFDIPSDKKLPKDTLGNSKDSTSKIVFFLVDAFGWCFYEKYKKSSSFLREIEKGGIVSKLTSQFPSTTTAHVTTALSGEPVYEHGLYEWFYYEPEADDIITAFLFKEARKKGIETLKNRNIEPKRFLPEKSFFKDLLENGIKSTVYQPCFINDSTYSNVMCKDATVKGYHEYEDLFESLSKDLTKNNDKEYYYVYLPEIDSIAHEKGNCSEEFKEAIEKLLKHMDKFYEKGKESFKNTAVMISADHGQVDTDLSTKYYLNDIMPDIDKYLKKNKNNDLISPTGFCRDLFLHVKEEHLFTVKKMIEKQLKDIVCVYTFDELKERGFFGHPSQRMIERCGNLILLPKDNNHIWWYEKDIFELSFIGVHGGASKNEMEIPLLFYRF